MGNFNDWFTNRLLMRGVQAGEPDQVELQRKADLTAKIRALLDAASTQLPDQFLPYITVRADSIADYASDVAITLPGCLPFYARFTFQRPLDEFRFHKYMLPIIGCEAGDCIRPNLMERFEETDDAELAARWTRRITAEYANLTTDDDDTPKPGMLLFSVLTRQAKRSNGGESD